MPVFTILFVDDKWCRNVNNPVATVQVIKWFIESKKVKTKSQLKVVKEWAPGQIQSCKNPGSVVALLQENFEKNQEFNKKNEKKYTVLLR